MILIRLHLHLWLIHSVTCSVLLLTSIVVAYSIGNYSRIELRHLDHHVLILGILENYWIPSTFTWLVVVHHYIHSSLLVEVDLLAWQAVHSAFVI